MLPNVLHSYILSVKHDLLFQVMYTHFGVAIIHVCAYNLCSNIEYSTLCIATDDTVRRSPMVQLGDSLGCSVLSIKT